MAAVVVLGTNETIVVPRSHGTEQGGGWPREKIIARDHTQAARIPYDVYQCRIPYTPEYQVTSKTTHRPG